jgi:hypothetical protein
MSMTSPDRIEMNLLPTAAVAAPGPGRHHGTAVGGPSEDPLRDSHDQTPVAPRAAPRTGVDHPRSCVRGHVTLLTPWNFQDELAVQVD